MVILAPETTETLAPDEIVNVDTLPPMVTLFFDLIAIVVTLALLPNVTFTLGFKDLSNVNVGIVPVISNEV